MKRSRLIWVLSAVLVLAAAGGGYAWWRTDQLNRAITAALPPQPDLRGWNQELKDRIAGCEQRARHGPDRLQALEELSRLYHANGFYPEASRCYQALIRLDASNPIWAHRLATLLAQYGDLAHAIPLWRWVVKNAPQHIQAAIRLGDALLKDNHLTEADEVYKRALARDPGNPYAQLGLARVEMARGNWTGARTMLESAAGATNYAIGGDLLVTVYEHLGLTERATALRAVTKASGAFYDIPDPWLDDLYSDCYDVYRLIIYSGTADHSGDLKTALLIAQRAVALGPNDGHAQFNLGTLYQQAGEPLKAMAAMKQCIAVLPSFSDAWYQLFALQRSQGDSANAIHTLMAGLQACPDSPGLHLELGRLLAQAGQNDQAIAQFNLAVKLRPQEPDAQLDLAALYFKLNEVDKGYAELHAAIEAEPGHPGALTSLAMASIKLGHEAEAIKWLRHIAYQPRVRPEDRQALDQAFVQQFGHPPDIGPLQ